MGRMPAILPEQQPARNEVPEQQAARNERAAWARAGRASDATEERARASVSRPGDAPRTATGVSPTAAAPPARACRRPLTRWWHERPRSDDPAVLADHRGPRLGRALGGPGAGDGLR